MWIRSQNRYFLVNCGEIEAKEVLERNQNLDIIPEYEIAASSFSKPDDGDVCLGRYYSEYSALYVLDQIQAHIDSGNTQTFQMPEIDF